MDVEKTMQFILESQAAFEVQMQKAMERMDRIEARVDKMEARFDKRFQAITKLMQTGMKMIVTNQKAIGELAAAQKTTDKKLQVLLDSLRRGANGR